MSPTPAIGTGHRNTLVEYNPYSKFLLDDGQAFVAVLTLAASSRSVIDWWRWR
ncbi:hypothetical protein TIFTF001_013859 [Ficus carica]|uniref:Uncharacterized protein n=1 Tax=Ficus carica TaxID=3494 RepID=A0AA88AQH6_FICCA|nr:hypothetical protein TIFTF001_013859 [Ficus carica]